MSVDLIGNLQPLPFVPKYIAGESLGGWLERVAVRYSSNAEQLFFRCALRVTEKKKVLVSGKNDSVILISHLTGHSSSQCTKLMDKEVSNFLPLKNIIQHSYSTVPLPIFPHMYCALCLYEDLELGHTPYYRALWSNPFSCVCDIHSCALTSRYNVADKLSVFEDIELETNDFGVNSHIYNLLSKRGLETNSRGDRQVDASNRLSPMAIRISNLFGCDEGIANKAATAINPNESVEHLQQQVLALFFILSFSGYSHNSLGDILFDFPTRQSVSFFPAINSPNLLSFTNLDTQQKIVCYDIVGMFMVRNPDFRRLSHEYHMKYCSVKLGGDFENNMKGFTQNPFFILFYYLDRYYGVFLLDQVERFFPSFLPTWRSSLEKYKSLLLA